MELNEPEAKILRLFYCSPIEEPSGVFIYIIQRLAIVAGVNTIRDLAGNTEHQRGTMI